MGKFYNREIYPTPLFNTSRLLERTVEENQTTNNS
jgi:hypothetical protein